VKKKFKKLRKAAGIGQFMQGIKKKDLSEGKISQQEIM